MQKILIIMAMAVSLTACGSSPRAVSADEQEANATKKIAAQGQKAVGGLPAITNFYEKRLLKEIYERRDQADLTTYAYTQGLDGKLNCLGQAIGYGVPYSTQYSNPQRVFHGRGNNGSSAAFIPQPEPNGLFTPEGMSATWLQLISPEGDVHVVYVEPTIVVSPFELSGPSVSSGC